MRVGLLKPKSLSIDDMSSRLKILNNYLVNFPLPDDKSFSEGEIIGIVLSILPVVCINSMIIYSLEPRQKLYVGLIEYLENLESYLPDEPICKRENRKDVPDIMEPGASLRSYMSSVRI